MPSTDDSIKPTKTKLNPQQCLNKFELAKWS